MRLMWIALLTGMLVSCGEPARSAPIGAAEMKNACASNDWQSRRCRCARRDARGCVHWQCRR